MARLSALLCGLLLAGAVGHAQQFPITLPAHVIVDSCSGCGGSAGPIAIDQTTPGTTNGVYVNNVPHIVCDSGCGSPPATADNSAFTFGTTSVSPIGAVVDDTATNAVAENSFGAPRMSANRVLYVDLKQTQANGTAIKVDGSAVTQPVSGTFWQATQPVSGTFFQATQPVSGTFWQATQPVSGTVTTTPPSNASTNVAQWAGTAVDVNSGTKSAGTIRVVLATDQPALTNKLLVTPDSVALPANQSVNVAQVAGATTATGNGTASGSLRVSLASDSTGNIATIGTSVTPGTAAANLGKAEDAAHTSGDTGVMNLGVRQDTTSTQITSAAGDYSPYAVDAFGTQYTRSDSPNRIKCFIDSTGTVLTVVTGCAAPGANLAIYITDISFYASVVSTTANRNLIQTGTGGACGTGTASLWAGYSPQVFSGSEAHFSTPLRASTNAEICFINATAGQKVVTISGFIAP